MSEKELQKRISKLLKYKGLIPINERGGISSYLKSI